MAIYLATLREIDMTGRAPNIYLIPYRIIPHLKESKVTCHAKL